MRFEIRSDSEGFVARSAAGERRNPRRLSRQTACRGERRWLIATRYGKRAQCASIPLTNKEFAVLLRNIHSSKPSLTCRRSIEFCFVRQRIRRTRRRASGFERAGEYFFSTLKLARFRKRKAKWRAPLAQANFCPPRNRTATSANLGDSDGRKMKRKSACITRKHSLKPLIKIPQIL